jgi:hypothetical protein
VCKGARLYNGYLVGKDDHDSWGMCTVVLTVMSGMDPDMISGTLVGSVLLVRSILRSGLYGVIYVPLSRC